MSIYEKRIKVLEWMGWTHVRLLDGGTIWGTKPGHESKNWKAGCEHDAVVPRLTLDWIHQCEKKLEAGFDGSEQDDYQQALYEKANLGRSLINDFNKEGLPDVAYVQNWICAPAEQRLDALYEVIK